jgi:hypothetical protein
MTSLIIIETNIGHPVSSFFRAREKRLCPVATGHCPVLGSMRWSKTTSWTHECLVCLRDPSPLQSDLSKDPWPPALDPRRRGAFRIKRRLRIPIRRTCPFTSREWPAPSVSACQAVSSRTGNYQTAAPIPEAIQKKSLIKKKLGDLAALWAVSHVKTEMACCGCLFHAFSVCWRFHPGLPESLSSPATATSERVSEGKHGQYVFLCRVKIRRENRPA